MGECEDELFWSVKMAESHGCMPASLHHCTHITSVFENQKHVFTHIGIVVYKNLGRFWTVIVVAC
jgi:hypothetical protein